MLTKVWYDIRLWISEFLLNLCDSLGCQLEFNHCYSCLHIIPTNLVFSNLYSVNNLLVSSNKRRRKGSCFIREVLIPPCVKWVLILLIFLTYRINIKYCWWYWVRIPSMHWLWFEHSLIKRIWSNANTLISLFTFFHFAYCTLLLCNRGDSSHIHLNVCLYP